MAPSASQRKGSTAMRISLPPPKPTTFPKFNDLPLELRISIWEMALPGPRIIILDLEDIGEGLGTPQTDQPSKADSVAVRSDAPPPSVLFVCRESRTVAHTKYKQAFINKMGSDLAETYFDFKHDVLYLGPRSPHSDYQGQTDFMIRDLFGPHDLSRIENLAVWWDNFWSGPESIEAYLAVILSRLGNVKNVTVVSKMYCMDGFRDTYPKMYAHLKFLDDMTEVAGRNIKLQGLDIPFSQSWMPASRVDMVQLEALSAISGGDGPDSSKVWKVPRINYNVITTPHGEELLLQEARDAKARELWGS